MPFKNNSVIMQKRDSVYFDIWREEDPQMVWQNNFWCDYRCVASISFVGIATST